MALHRAAQIEKGETGFLRILSIDGGGMRGIVPAVLLDALESRLKRPLSQVFDLIAGTSTGGIIALALSKPAPDGKPQYSPAAICDLYRKHGKTIFNRSLGHRVETLGGLTGPKYPSDGIERVLREYFGDVRLSKALTRVMVTSYDTAGSTPYFFKSFRPAVDGFASAHAEAVSPDDHLMWLAARATSAAPTYFPPLALDPIERAEPQKALVDGGVFANNPAMCALAEAVRRFPDRKYLLVSVGTGAEEEQLLYRDVRRFGLAAWAVPILKVVFDGVSDAADYELRHILDSSNYFRFQCDNPGLQLDDTSDEAMERLLQCAHGLVKASTEDLDRLADLLR
jgi:patatin-like phospholipase/acyl hydrolase